MQTPYRKEPGRAGDVCATATDSDNSEETHAICSGTFPACGLHSGSSEICSTLDVGRRLRMPNGGRDLTFHDRSGVQCNRRELSRHARFPMSHLDRLLAECLPEITSIRHALHAHPQLGYEETYASELVQNKLLEWNIPFVNGIAETGVVAWLEPPGAQPDQPAIGLRGEMDALPILEATGLPYSSTNPGIMHACGHDGHTSILLATAYILSKLRKRLPRPVKMLFQPAEEDAAGAQRIVEAGALTEKFGGRRVAAMFGMHGRPLFAGGMGGCKPGPLRA